MANGRKRSSTGYPDIYLYTQDGRTPRYASRFRDNAKKIDKSLGSFPTLQDALNAQTEARRRIEAGEPLLPTVLWREQVGMTGISKRYICGKTWYRYEISITVPITDEEERKEKGKDAKIKAYRSGFFASEGAAHFARSNALQRLTAGEEIGVEGLSWREIRYPIGWCYETLDFPPPSINITVRNWSLMWWERIVTPAPINRKEKRRYKCHIHRHIVRTIGSKEVRFLTSTDIELVDGHLSKKGPESKKTVRTTMWRMFESARANGLLMENPVLRTPLSERSKAQRLAYARRRRQAA